KREDHQFAVLANGSDLLAIHHSEAARGVRCLHVEHLLALAGIGEALVLGHHEANSLRAPYQEFSAALMAQHGDEIWRLLKIDEQPHRLAMTAAAREFRAIERVETSVGGEHQDLRGGLRRERELETVVGLERDTRQIGDVSAQRADPALLRDNDGDR